MVWVGRDLRRPPSPTPCSEQGHLHLDQGAHSPVQPGLGWFQGWGINHRSGQPVPGPHQCSIISRYTTVPRCVISYCRFLLHFVWVFQVSLEFPLILLNWLVTKTHTHKNAPKITSEQLFFSAYWRVYFVSIFHCKTPPLKRPFLARETYWQHFPWECTDYFIVLFIFYFYRFLIYSAYYVTHTAVTGEETLVLSNWQRFYYQLQQIRNKLSNCQI